ncbi:hypothetical protein C8J57DRAFT_1517236 [Mycena rebaudengoi]|nr:hypothetical protein C8J57DRAFT_1517236 [Mycena rebaudengoi]
MRYHTASSRTSVAGGSMEAICDCPGIGSRILARISSRDIYAISCVCRRLHDVFLAVFLQNHGFLEPYDQCEVLLDNDEETLEFDTVAAFKSARFVLPDNVKRLSFFFMGAEDLVQMTKNMRRCLSLLHKFNLEPSGDTRYSTHAEHLRTFLIDSPILVLPAFYTWTLSNIRSRPSITTLRLHMLLAPADWAAMLPTMITAVPQLTQLTILGIQIDIAALLRPIVTLKHLESLKLDSAVDFYRASFRTISKFSSESAIAAASSLRGKFVMRFLNLTTLVARPEHVYILLWVHNSLRALTSLCIRLELLELVAQATLRVMKRTLSRLHEPEARDRAIFVT